MTNFIKNNIALLLGLLIPVVMVIFVAGSIYLPGYFVHPKTNFMYVVGDDSYCSRYTVANGTLTLNAPSAVACNNITTSPKLYVYDTATEKSNEVPLEVATTMRLDDSLQSPDGFTLKQGGSGGDGILFWGGVPDYNSEYLVGHGYSHKLPLVQNSSYYSNSFRFLGWITQ